MTRIVVFPFQQWFPERATTKHFTTSSTLFPLCRTAALTRNSYRPAAHSEELPNLSNLSSFKHSSCNLSNCQTWTAVSHACYMRVTLTVRLYDATSTFEIIQSVGAGLAQPLQELPAGWTVRRIPVWTRFSAPVQSGPGAQLFLVRTMGTRSLSRG